ncbi:MAG TPA: prephenate dehydratase domain-containing protein, partial [Thermoguttaceae bacterium]|nr:prephenate dehydratase domain-containing protein [Thermoguttaceae bacterium]
VADTLDMFTRLPLQICGEVELPIHHALLAKCSRGEIREVYSKPQALSQCRNWLAKHLPAARGVEVTSTSTAAELAAAKPGAAAIASVQAGTHFGLTVLAEQIEDNPNNVTRFCVIGKEPAERTGRDKTAIMFQLENRSGALADALNVFKRCRVNLTWIESFPMPGTDRAYLFFVEMEGHHGDLGVRRALASLAKKTVRMTTLGSFPAVGPRTVAKGLNV